MTFHGFKYVCFYFPLPYYSNITVMRRTVFRHKNHSSETNSEALKQIQWIQATLEYVSKTKLNVDSQSQIVAQDEAYTAGLKRAFRKISFQSPSFTRHII